MDGKDLDSPRELDGERLSLGGAEPSSFLLGSVVPEIC